MGYKVENNPIRISGTVQYVALLQSTAQSYEISNRKELGKHKIALQKNSGMDQAFMLKQAVYRLIAPSIKVVDKPSCRTHSVSMISSVA